MKIQNFLIATILTVLTACNVDSLDREKDLTIDKLIGKWQLSATYTSPGGDTEWVDVEAGQIWVFESTGAFREQDVPAGFLDKSGTFTIEDGLLKLKYVQDGKKQIQNFYIELSGDTIIVSPSGPIFCIEACLSKYKKIV